MSAARGGALSQIQVVRLASRAGVRCALGGGARTVGQGNLESERGAAIEVGARAASVAHNIEFGQSPDGGDVNDTVLSADRIGFLAVVEHNGIVTPRHDGTRQ